MKDIDWNRMWKEKIDGASWNQIRLTDRHDQVGKGLSVSPMDRKVNGI